MHLCNTYQTTHENYINTEIPSCNKPLSLRNSSDPKLDERKVKSIITKYQIHPSVQKIKNSLSSMEFDLRSRNNNERDKIINSVHVNQVTDPDCIPSKFVQLSPDITDSHFSLGRELFRKC